MEIVKPGHAALICQDRVALNTKINICTVGTVGNVLRYDPADMSIFKECLDEPAFYFSLNNYLQGFSSFL